MSIRHGDLVPRSLGYLTERDHMKITRTIAIGGAALATAAGLILGGTAAASAHDGAGKARGSGGAGLSALITDGTVSQAQANAIRDALQANHQANRADHRAEREQARDAALASLVADGTLTQAQADAIKGADRGGMRELLSSGIVDRADLQAVRDALHTAREADREAKHAQREQQRTAALASLVADGTITQAQADAVASAIESAHAERGTGNKGHGKGAGMRGMKGPRA